MVAEPTASIPQQVRQACAWVAARARAVRIEEEAIEAYARGLGAAPDEGADYEVAGDREARAAFVICLDAINFGSGWWPTIRKRPGLSGYRTVEAGLRERFAQRGPWSADELTALSPTDVATVLGQHPDHPLMADFAVSLRDVGAHVLADHGGSFEAVADAAGGSAVGLADLLGGWAAFADNLVPHVLRVDGVLRVDLELTAAIEAGELLEHGSPGEVELRACAVQAVELLAAASEPVPTAAEIDAALWSRGRAARYKSLPRPRSRNTAY